MKRIDLLEEAQDCRRRALTYVGQPEAKLLLRVAKEFEQMNKMKRPIHSSWQYKSR
jgi:desulfoferrodoxin (superoxide reductase-like protein)